jgi:DNA polymerase I-like protein with 3'-5' exonuclease and polymerase domains
MKIYHSNELPSGAKARFFAYNGLDTMLCHELSHKVQEKVEATAPSSSRFSHLLVGPVLTMMRRGFLVDQAKAEETAASHRERLACLQATLDDFVSAVPGWIKPKKNIHLLNISSNAQLKKFFYEAMALPPVVRSDKGEMKVKANRDALEYLAKNYVRAKPFCDIINRMKDLKGELDVFSRGLVNGRFLYSFNIGGTDTFRYSSNAHPTRYGQNIQNINPELRHIFIPDPGYTLVSSDLQGAEARLVAYLSGDENYIKAVESGDVHTMVASMCFGFEPKRELAEKEFWNGFSFRDISKKLTHGCVTGDHEVLTRSGWKRIDQVSPKEQIMVWDTNFNSWFEYPSNWTSWDCEEDLVSFEGNSLSLLCTKAHRIPYSNVKDKIQEGVASHVMNVSSARVPKVGNYLGGDNFVTPEQARLVAAFHADGSYSGPFGMKFHFRKKRKIDRLLGMLEGREPLVRESSRGTIHISVRTEKAKDVTEWGKAPSAAMLDWPREALIAYVDELQHWDAYKHGSTIQVTTTSEETADWLQTIITLCGKGAIQGYVHQGSGFNPKAQVRMISINSRTMASVESMETSLVPGGQKVYCPTVSTGFFLVRRNKKIFVTGNSSYCGTPRTLATQGNIQLKLVEDFQKKFFKAFPGIRSWQEWVGREVQAKGLLITPFGRRRVFWDRRWDDTTVRAAVAFVPQSTIGDYMHVIEYLIWHSMEPKVQLLANGHDSIVFQLPTPDVATLLPSVVELMKVEVPVTDITGRTRILTLPSDHKVGSNWGDRIDRDKNSNPLPPDKIKNPNGLRKWIP